MLFRLLGRACLLDKSLTLVASINERYARLERHAAVAVELARRSGARDRDIAAALGIDHAEIVRKFGIRRPPIRSV